MLLWRQLAEWSSSRVVLDDVARGDNILKAVALGDVTALLTLTTNDKNSAVGLGHLAHRGVTADELAGLNILLKLAR